MKLNFNDNRTHAHNAHFTTRDVEDSMKIIGYTKIHTIGATYLKLLKIVERRFK